MDWFWNIIRKLRHITYSNAMDINVIFSKRCISKQKLLVGCWGFINIEFQFALKREWKNILYSVMKFTWKTLFTYARGYYIEFDFFWNILKQFEWTYAMEYIQSFYYFRLNYKYNLYPRIWYALMHCNINVKAKKIFLFWF